MKVMCLITTFSVATLDCKCLTLYATYHAHLAYAKIIMTFFFFKLRPLKRKKQSIILLNIKSWSVLYNLLVRNTEIEECCQICQKIYGDWEQKKMYIPTAVFFPSLAGVNLP